MKNKYIYINEKDEILAILKNSLEHKIFENDSKLKERFDYIYIYLKHPTNPLFYIENKEDINQIIEKISSILNNNINNKLNNYCLANIQRYIEQLYRMCRDDSFQSVDFNSENYYNQQFKELQDKRNKLNEELSLLDQKTAEHLEKVKELNFINEQLKQNITGQEELKKKLDARDNLKERISIAFKELKTHVSHLEKEKTRLNWMFYIYAILCGFVLIILMYFEYSYLSKWINSENTTWIDYAPFYIPVPIVGGLLWAFIFQMNRAQRQLMQVANVLYHIDYVEGLLLAINLISSDVNSASEKICNVLDSLIKNYMSIPDSLSEQSLDKAISKDNINLHTFINLAKEVKEVIK